MNELIISAIMQNKNNRRFEELLSETESERLYSQQTSPRSTLWDQLIAAGKQLEPRERGAIKPACVCSKLA